MKTRIYIDPPARDFGRLPRCSKHCRGTQGRVILGERETLPKTAAERMLVATHGLQAQREQDRLVKEFVDSLTGTDREFADSVKLAKPLADPEPRGSGDDGEEISESEPIPEGELRGTLNGRTPLICVSHPVIDQLEPAGSVAIEELSEAQVMEAHAAFGRAVAWIHEQPGMVQVGRRLGVLIGWARPDLGTGKTEFTLRGLLTLLFDDEERRLLCMVFGRVFAWCREGATLSAMGLRGKIIAYVIRPGILDAATNAQLGSPTNSTRQAVNKLVQEFRDTFAGIRAPAMRGEETRRACRKAQFEVLGDVGPGAAALA